MNHQPGVCLRTGNDDLLAQEKSRDDVRAPVEVVVHLGVSPPERWYLCPDGTADGHAFFFIISRGSEPSSSLEPLLMHT